MKKKILLSILISSLFLIGCGKYDDKDVIKDFEKKVDSAKGYYLKGEMAIINNEDTYKYKVEVSYMKDNKFRVSLMNVANNHEQIILKNEDGVYVLTPSLNKSFKFQSEWPYNNSQVYLLQSLLKDIKGDNNKTFEQKENYYIFTTKANYPNNKRLISEKIFLDKKLNVKEVQVLDSSKQIQIKMQYTSIDMKATFDKDYFSLNQNMKAANINSTEETTSKIEDIVYPMYIPANTHLTAQDTVAKEKGERVILTFSGDSPFMLVEETVSIDDELVTIPTYGEPYLLADTIGALSDSSVSWISGGIEYYVVSDKLSKAELLEVANSISVMPVGK